MSHSDFNIYDYIHSDMVEDEQENMDSGEASSDAYDKLEVRTPS